MTANVKYVGDHEQQSPPSNDMFWREGVEKKVARYVIIITSVNIINTCYVVGKKKLELFSFVKIKPKYFLPLDSSDI